MTVVVFAGPTLPPRARPVTEGLWDWRPPVRQGDLYRAALDSPVAIGVVDGYFEVVPTVWHKEILWAMSRGIHVFGAASIGALRAAELDVFGMCGVGEIYRNFRDGLMRDDDEVAVLHGPAEVGYPLLTEAMVNIRATLMAAVAGDVLAADVAGNLTDIAKTLFYKERTYAAVLAAAAARGLPAAMLNDFAHWLPSGRVDLKRRDAEAMLAAIRSLIAAWPGPLVVDFTLADTAAWQAARRNISK